MEDSGVKRSFSTPCEGEDCHAALTRCSKTPPLTPKRSGKMLALKILLLDDTVTIIQAQTKALGRVVFEQICKQLNVLEADYFGLEYQDHMGTKFWLDLEKRLSRQVGLSLVDPSLKFAVKFYTPDPSQLEEEFTRYLFSLQVKRDLAQGILVCNENTAALMASFLVQAECGDFSEEDYPDASYLSTFKFIPGQDREMEKRIRENHKKHIGKSPAEADLYLLETARRTELFGIKMFKGKDEEGVPLNISVSNLGILIFQQLTKINTFSWAKIRKISFKRKRFILKLHPESGFGYYKETVEFFFETRNECKSFWKRCVEHHAFFRCEKAPGGYERGGGLLSNRGSSFRYSGRTQKQMVAFVRDNFVKRAGTPSNSGAQSGGGAEASLFQRSASFRSPSALPPSAVSTSCSSPAICHAPPVYDHGWEEDSASPGTSATSSPQHHGGTQHVVGPPQGKAAAPPARLFSHLAKEFPVTTCDSAIPPLLTPISQQVQQPLTHQQQQLQSKKHKTRKARSKSLSATKNNNLNTNAKEPQEGNFNTMPRQRKPRNRKRGVLAEDADSAASFGSYDLLAEIYQGEASSSPSFNLRPIDLSRHHHDHHHDPPKHNQHHHHSQQLLQSQELHDEEELEEEEEEFVQEVEEKEGNLSFCEIQVPYLLRRRIDLDRPHAELAKSRSYGGDDVAPRFFKFCSMTNLPRAGAFSWRDDSLWQDEDLGLIHHTTSLRNLEESSERSERGSDVDDNVSDDYENVAETSRDLVAQVEDLVARKLDIYTLQEEEDDEEEMEEDHAIVAPPPKNVLDEVLDNILEDDEEVERDQVLEEILEEELKDFELLMEKKNKHRDLLYIDDLCGEEELIEGEEEGEKEDEEFYYYDEGDECNNEIEKVQEPEEEDDDDEDRVVRRVTMAKLELTTTLRISDEESPYSVVCPEDNDENVEECESPLPPPPPPDSPPGSGLSTPRFPPPADSRRSSLVDERRHSLQRCFSVDEDPPQVPERRFSFEVPNVDVIKEAEEEEDEEDDEVLPVLLLSSSLLPRTLSRISETEVTSESTTTDDRSFVHKIEAGLTLLNDGASDLDVTLTPAPLVTLTSELADSSATLNDLEDIAEDLKQDDENLVMEDFDDVLDQEYDCEGGGAQEAGVGLEEDVREEETNSVADPEWIYWLSKEVLIDFRVYSSHLALLDPKLPNKTVLKTLASFETKKELFELRHAIEIFSVLTKTFEAEVQAGKFEPAEIRRLFSVPEEFAHFIPVRALALRPIYRIHYFVRDVIPMLENSGQSQLTSLGKRLGQTLRPLSQRLIPLELELESEAKADEVGREMAGAPSDPGTFFRQGILLKLNKKRGLQSRIFFLFRDYLLYGTRVSSAVGFRLHGIVRLYGAQVMKSYKDLDDEFGPLEAMGPNAIPHSFSIVTSEEKVLVLAALSQEDKNVWIRDLVQICEKLAQPRSATNFSSSEELLGGSEREPSDISHRANSTLHVTWHRSVTCSHLALCGALRVCRSGYLLRKFKNSSGWQKLFVVLVQTCLFFYKSSEGSEGPLASLPLLGYRVEEAPEEGKDNVFKLVFKNHVYLFRTDSRFGLERWTQGLATACTLSE